MVPGHTETGGTLRITFDPLADAMYVQSKPFDNGDVGETHVNEDGVIIETDLRGNTRGYEFLQIKFRGLFLDGLPKEVSDAINEFVRSGALQAIEYVDRQVD
jgi:uncharacterized protein YuzE